MPSTPPSIDTLRKIPLFRTLDDATLTAIVESPGNRVIPMTAGDVVMRAGDQGHCMFIVLEGALDVVLSAEAGLDVSIATLKAGDFFGEQALLPGDTQRRNATVRALTAGRIYRIDRDHARLSVASAPERPPERPTGTAPVQVSVYDPVREAERIRDLLRSVRLFKALSEDDFEHIDEWVEVMPFKPGAMVLREGEHGDDFFVILEGVAEVFTLDDDGRIVSLAQLTQGHYFGEQALLPQSDGRRNAYVRANTALSLVRVDRAHFQLILGRDQKLELALRAVGQAQRRRIIEAAGDDDDL